MRWPFRRHRRLPPPPVPVVPIRPRPVVRLVYTDGSELVFPAGSAWATAFQAVADTLTSRTRHAVR